MLKLNECNRPERKKKRTIIGKQAVSFCKRYTRLMLWSNIVGAIYKWGLSKHPLRVIVVILMIDGILWTNVKDYDTGILRKINESLTSLMDDPIDIIGYICRPF